MDPTLFARALTGIALCTGSACAFAHGGHGFTGTHWHTSDTLGFLLVAVLAAAAVWLSRK